MGIKHDTAFYSTREEEERAKDKVIVLSIKLNQEEQEQIGKAMPIFRQNKDSTIIKQLAIIGAKVILSDLQQHICSTLFKNEVNNMRKHPIVISDKMNKSNTNK